MARLPVISYPSIAIKLPPNNKEYRFRPMLVKEEKLLLMAKVSGEPSEILHTIKQVVTNCALDKMFKIDPLPLFLLEFIFVRLRAFSVGDQIHVDYRDNSDEQLYGFDIDLKKIEIKYPNKENFKIE